MAAYRPPVVDHVRNPGRAAGDRAVSDARLSP
jgi:hypothetical protein